MKRFLTYANIEGIKRLRKIAIVGTLTRGRLAGNYILGKRGYLKLSGVEMPWMRVESFKEKFAGEVHNGFFTAEDRKDGPFYFTERASISNTNAFNIWVDNGICSNKEWESLRAEAREGYLSGSSYTDYKIVSAPDPRLAFAEAVLGYDEYDKECDISGYENDLYDDDAEEDYSGE